MPKRTSSKSTSKKLKKKVGKKLNERTCRATKPSGETCGNYICSTSDKYCKIHFLKKLHSRMIDKEDTIATMASPVTPEGDIWIGSLASAQHKQFLKKYGIKSILNVSGIEPLPHTKKMYNEQKIAYYTFTEIDPETKEEKFMPDVKFDDEIFTKADFLNYASKAIKAMKGFNGPILVHCFTEEHQILTNKGFMFLKDFENHKEDEDLLVAGFDPNTQCIVYEKHELIINPHSEYDMINLTQTNEARRWTGESDKYGRSNNEEKDMPSNSVSLVTTREHKMYVKNGLTQGKGIYWKTHKQMVDGKKKNIQDPYHKVDAETLLSNNERDCVKFLAKADGGLINPDTEFAFIRELNLDNEDKINAFMEMYGYWLGDGSLNFKTEFGKSKNDILFSPVKKIDHKWILDRFETLGFKQNEHYKIYKPAHDSQLIFSLIEPNWVKMFHDEYGKKYKTCKDYDSECMTNQSKSAKWMFDWVYTLNKEHAKRILAGLRMADGDEAVNENSIYTSSNKFRDEIVMLAIHAGYSPFFALTYEKGANRGVINGKDVIARFNNWKVSFNSSVQYAEPNLRQKGDVSETKYTGRTWCVSVPHTFIFVRRAHFDESENCVTKASRAIVCSNCQAGMNRSAAMIAAYLICARGYSFEKTVKALEEANKKRGISALKNGDFRKILKEMAHFCHLERRRKDKK